MILRPPPKPKPSAFALEALARLPLAEAVLSLWRYALQATFLDGVFDRHRGRSYTEILTFSDVVELVADALVRHRGSGRASFRHAQEQGTLETSAEAVYGKLRRLPLSLSLGFVEEVTARLLPLLPAGAQVVRLPDCLAKLTVVIGDGKTLKRVARRLRATRGVTAKLSGGKLLVGYLPALGLVLTMTADRDGETNEARLVPALLQRADGCIRGPRLWVLDRQFCDLVQAQRLIDARDHFVIRYHQKVHFTADAALPAHYGTDDQGRPVVEEWGWLGAARNRGRRYVRRLTVLGPAGEEVVAVVTDLLDWEAYPVLDLLGLYRKRWGIEQVFQQITEVFELRRLIGSSPEATVFQAAFCLVLYNLIQVVRHYVAIAHACAVAELSTEQLYRDVQEELTALCKVVPLTEVAACIAAVWTVESVAARLGQLLAGAWSPRWRKAVNRKPRLHQAKSKGKEHTSVHRLQEAHRRKQLNNDPKT
jgi:hypothetical protein